MTWGKSSRLAALMLCALLAACGLDSEQSLIEKARVARTLPGTIEIVAYFYMVAVSFLPLGFCQAKGEHVSADAFVSVIPRSLRPYAEWLGKMLSVIVCLILLWATTDMAIRQTLLGEAVRSAYFDIPVWLSRWLVPLGLLSMVLVMLAQMFMPKEMQERHEQSEEYQHEQSPDY